MYIVRDSAKQTWGGNQNNYIVIPEPNVVLITPPNNW